MQDSRKTPQTSRENIACNDYPSYGSITWLSKALQPFQVSFANSTEYELLQSWPACYGAISLPRTRLNDSHLRMFITVALQEEYVRTALISFSSYVLYMKGETRFPTSYILESYQSSVQKLSRQLSARSYTHNYLALLISATMLGVVESSGMGNPHITTAHLTLAIYACTKFLHQQACDTGGRQICRLAAELWLYNLPSSCLFLLEQELSRLFQYLDKPLVDVVFHPDPSTSASAHSLSPFLGIPPGIILLLLRTVHLSRQRGLACSAISSRRAKLVTELHELEAGLDGYYGKADTDDADTQRDRDISHLFLHAIAMYLVHIGGDSHSDKFAQLQSKMDAFLKLLNKERDTLVETSLLWWPLAVVVCAAEKYGLSRECLSRAASSHFDGGCKKRWDILMEKLAISQRKSATSAGVRGISTLEKTNALTTAIEIQATAEGGQQFNSFTATNPGPKTFWIWQK